MTGLILAVMGAVLAPPGWSPHPPEPTARDTVVTVQGQVVDFATNQPMANALVVAEPGGQVTLTNEDGRFRLAVPWPETLGLNITQLGYQDTFLPLTEPDQFTSLLARIPPNPVLLDRLEVVADRFKSRRQREMRRLQILEPADLARSGAGNAWDLVVTRVPFSRPCRLNRDFLCRWGRMGLGSRSLVAMTGSGVSGVSGFGETTVSICINGRPALSGAAELRAYPIAQVYRVELVGTFPNLVRMWTWDYMQLMLKDEAFLPRPNPATGC